VNAEKKPRAWIVPVRTTRLGGGHPLSVCYIAGHHDPSKAMEAVRQHIGALDGDELKDPWLVSDATADALGVRDGMVWML
jgi:hypothetical protein